MPDQEYLVTALQEENDEGEDEEAPSLCDLPLTGAVGEQSNERRCSLSESADFFEFNISSYTVPGIDLDWPLFSSTADGDQIISEQLTSPPPSSTSVSRSIEIRRSDCSNESKIATRSSSTRSLGYRRIRRDLMNYDQFSPERENRSYSSNGAQRRSPPWYWPALRPSRYPPAAAEIKLRSGAKIRKHRSPATLFPAAEKASRDRSTWRVINALSCKSHGSVAVTTPFHPYY